MNKEQFLDVTMWQKETFPKSTLHSKLKHLEEEIIELSDSWTEANGHLLFPVEMEIADCFILLFGAANEAGMTYEDIVSAISQKMKINKERNWGIPDHNGVVKHIKKQ